MITTVASDFYPSQELSFQAWPPSPGQPPLQAQQNQHAAHQYLIGVNSSSASQIMESLLPMLDQLLVEKTAQVREKKLEDMIEFMTAQLVRPTTLETQMAHRLALRRARILNEFGFVTAEQLADENQSRSKNRHALADNWKKRRQVIAVSHRDESGRAREVFPLFQFDNFQPIKTIQPILEIFGDHKTAWKIALWFASNNAWLPDQARPLDLLETDPAAVLLAAQREVAEGAA
jgi:hypothetical protein